jgi:uncharacterized protein DUF2829
MDLQEENLMEYSFGTAVLMLKNGERVAREGWNGKDMYLELQVPDENSKMTRPYIFMKTVNDELVPWVASQSDILVDDWYRVADGYAQTK